MKNLHEVQIANWQTFIQALTGNDTVDVSEVTDSKVTFTANGSVAAFQKQLGDKDVMLANVVRAIPNASKTSAPAPQKFSEEAKRLQHLLSITGQQLLERLFDSDYLKNNGFSTTYNFTTQESNGVKEEVATLNFQTPARLNRALTTIELLQSALCDHELIAKTLLQPSWHKIKASDEQAVTTDFASSLFTVQRSSEKSGDAKVVFHKDILLQMIQSLQTVVDGVAPIVATRQEADEVTMTLNRNTLLAYAQRTLETNLVFHNGNTPVAFMEAGKAATKPVHFNMLLDVSGSMEHNFGKYLDGVKKVVDDVRVKSKEFTITITPFANDRYQELEFTNTTENIERILRDFFGSLRANGGTQLNDSILATAKEIMQETSKNSNQVLFVFTDGDDLHSTNKSGQEIKSINELRSKNPQFAIYTMGFGQDYNQAYFANLAQTVGAHHFHLKSNEISKLSDLTRVLGNLNVARVLFSFIDEHNQQSALQATSGQVTVGQPISPNAQITYSNGLGANNSLYRTGGSLNVTGGQVGGGGRGI